MATTTNFGWETPDDTDLVKDGALAMRTLGNAIDASLVDLKGGTTGQVLSKTSNTDMDFTWVTSDDANAIQNAIVDAKGDLIAASAADTPARLAVGNNGDTLVADSSASTGLRWQGNFAAGKNAIINGDFRINQRSFTSNTANQAYNFDRWFQFNGGTSGTQTVTPQTFTLGTAPVAGYEGKNFIRSVTAAGADIDTRAGIAQRIESVTTFANQVITVSFWAKANSGTPKIALEMEQSFGTGGSPSSGVQTAFGAVTISTSWARYSITGTVPSIAGKTLGTNNNDFLVAAFWLSAGSNFASRASSIGLQNNTFDIWGVQVEAGNVATAFQTATGTLAGELAACLYYFNRIADFSAGGSNGQQMIVTAQNFATTGGYGVLQYPKMRISPTATFSGNADFYATGAGGNNIATTAMAANSIKPNSAEIRYTTASGLVAGNAALLYTTTTTGKLDLSAEL